MSCHTFYIQSTRRNSFHSQLIHSFPRKSSWCAMCSCPLLSRMSRKVTAWARDALKSQKKTVTLRSCDVTFASISSNFSCEMSFSENISTRSCVEQSSDSLKLRENFCSCDLSSSLRTRCLIVLYTEIGNYNFQSERALTQILTSGTIIKKFIEWIAKLFTKTSFVRAELYKGGVSNKKRQHKNT